MIFEYQIFAHCWLLLFNAANAFGDAYLIVANKKIAHGINFGAYAALTGVLTWRYRMNVPEAVLFGVSAFFNRQVSFDPLLNLRRGLKWFYQSIATPPKAIMDQIEQRLFGHISGQHLAFMYLLFCISFTSFQLVV